MRMIDADAFFEKFRAGGDLYSELLESEDMREILKDEDITPTVDAKPVTHAHWELEREPDGSPYCFHCSNCDYDWARIDVKSEYEYCPHCGAKMEGDTDD